MVVPTEPLTEEQELDQLADQLARENTSAFCERVLKSPETDSPVVLDVVHRLELEHVEECWKEGYYAGVVMPWDHGKTLIGVLGNTLKALGENTRLRAKIICNNFDNAVKRVETVANYIQHDQDFQRVFPDCVPEMSESRGGPSKWTSNRIQLQRKTYGPDSSLEAWGITSSVEGGRCDFMIFDDPVDLQNAVLNPGDREKIKTAFYGKWLSRLVPSGRLAYFATVWHEDDLTSELKNNPAFMWLEVKVSDDFKELDCTRWRGGTKIVQEFSIPLWDRYNEEVLRKKFRAMGAREFNRGYRQRPYSDKDRTFPNFKLSYRYGKGRHELVQPTWPTIVGVDLAGKKRKGTVIFIGKVNPKTRLKVPWMILHGSWSGAEKARQLQAVYEQYNPVAMFVENNAQQQDLIDICEEHPDFTFGDVLQGHLTGQEKFDPFIGIPGMDIEFARDGGTSGWLIPQGEFGGPEHLNGDCGECGWCRWTKEMDQHPFAKWNDAMMASWIFREGVRKYFKGGGELDASDLGLHNQRRYSDGLPSVQHLHDGLKGAVHWGD